MDVGVDEPGNQGESGAFHDLGFLSPAVENVADRGHPSTRYRHITDLDPTSVHLKDRATTEDQVAGCSPAATAAACRRSLASFI